MFCQSGITRCLRPADQSMYIPTGNAHSGNSAVRQLSSREQGTCSDNNTGKRRNYRRRSGKSGSRGQLPHYDVIRTCSSQDIWEGHHTMSTATARAGDKALKNLDQILQDVKQMEYLDALEHIRCQLDTMSVGAGEHTQGCCELQNDADRSNDVLDLPSRLRSLLQLSSTLLQPDPIKCLTYSRNTMSTGSLVSRRSETSKDQGQLRLDLAMVDDLLVVRVHKARQLTYDAQSSLGVYVQVSLLPHGNDPDFNVTDMATGSNPAFKEKFELTTHSNKQRVLLEVKVVSPHHKSSLIGGMSFGVHSIQRQPVSGWFYILDHELAMEKHMRVRPRKSKIPTRPSRSRPGRIPLRPYTSSPTLGTGLLPPPARLTRSATDGDLNQTFTISPSSVRTPRELLTDISRKTKSQLTTSHNSLNNEFSTMGPKYVCYAGHKRDSTIINNTHESRIHSSVNNVPLSHQIRKPSLKAAAPTMSDHLPVACEQTPFTVRVLNDTNAIRQQQGNYTTACSPDIFSDKSTNTFSSGHVSASTPDPSALLKISSTESSRHSVMSPEFLSLSMLDTASHLAEENMSESDKRRAIYSSDNTSLDSWLASPTWQRILNSSTENSTGHRGILVWYHWGAIVSAVLAGVHSLEAARSCDKMFASLYNSIRDSVAVLRHFLSCFI